MTHRARRQVLSHALALGLFPTLSWAQPKGQRPMAEGPRVSADPSVIDSGLSARWHAAMAKDLGWSTPFAPVESGVILDQLDQGLTDVGLFLSHPKADSLDKQGLIYERHVLAQTDVLLLGPPSDPAGIHGEKDAGRALTQILAASGAGRAAWQAPVAGSALAGLADTLTNGLASKGLSASGAGKATQGPAYQLVTRVGQAKAGKSAAGTKVWPIDDPRLSLNLEAALSFRSRHSAGKLLVTWLQWPLAQSIVGKSGPAWRRVKG